MLCKQNDARMFLVGTCFGMLIIGCTFVILHMVGLF
jgi:hypothetical protein